MISIKPNAAWTEVDKIFGKDILLRYEWFLNMFGQEAARLFHKHLLEATKTLPGGMQYKRRLALAEIRDKKRLYWTALVATAKRLGDARHDPATSVFQVIPRYDLPEDPTRIILEKYGPWTIETIPFVPSPRQAQVVLKTVSPAQMKAVQAQNQFNSKSISVLMDRLGVVFQNRTDVYEELRVIRDFEVDAIAWEYGVRDGGRPHWRPSLRWLKTQGVKRLEKNKDLVAVFTRSSMRRYRIRRKLRLKLSLRDIQGLAKFQDKVRV